MTNYKQLTEQVKNHVQTLFKTHVQPELLYHNITHTIHVVEAATQIANHYGLGDADFFIVVAAAWFHDVGYLKMPEGHEAVSACEAVDFLASRQVNPSICEAVSNCILATKMPQQPNNLCGQILCDADLFHIGTGEFWKNNQLLRKEYDMLHNTAISKDEWLDKTVKMMQAHQYFTDYCQRLLGTKKEQNTAEVFAKQKE